MNLCSLSAPPGSGGVGWGWAGLGEGDQQLGHKGPALWNLAFPCISVGLAIKCTLTVVSVPR